MEAQTKGPKLIVNIAVLAQGKALLVKYKDMPDHQVGWFVPHELLPFGENPQKLVDHLLSSQLGLKTAQFKMSHVESFTGRDGSWHLPLHYGLLLEAMPSLVLHEKIAQTEWFSLEALPEVQEVAHHGWALDIIKTVRSNL